MQPLFDTATPKNSEPLSASDQKITITRPLGVPVKFTIAGKEYEIRPPSHWLLRIIGEYKLEHREKLIREGVSAKSLYENLFGSENNPETESISDVDKNLKVVRNMAKFFWKVGEVTDEFAIKLVQLILLDAEKPDWKDTAKGFPSKDLLDSVVTYDTLYRHSNSLEMGALLELYDGMQKPEEMRKNFEKWGIMELLTRGSAGQDSGG